MFGDHKSTFALVSFTIITHALPRGPRMLACHQHLTLGELKVSWSSVTWPGGKWASVCAEPCGKAEEGTNPFA